MNLKVNDIYNVEILSQENEGLGVCRVNDIVVFVENGLPGEKGEILITEIKKNYARAVMKKIDIPSINRQKPPCQYYPECGGCDLQHQSYKDQLLFKKNKVKMALEHIGGFKNIIVNDPIFREEFHYRNKVTLKVNGSKLGFYQSHTNDIIDINYCLISNENINKTIEALQFFIKEHYDNTFKTIMIRFSNGLMIDIDSDNDMYINELLAFILTKIDLKSLWLNQKLMYGSEYVEEKIGTYKFKLLPASFYQVNNLIMKELYSKVVDYTKTIKNDLILDLYCGVGTITTLLSDHATRIIGVEENANAVENAKDSALINKIDNIIFKQGKVEKIIDELVNEKVDTIVVDPPRSGVDIRAISAILKMKPKQIIYVSCNPTTLARDLKILCEDNYIMEEVTPFDMFPQTSHVECVVKLTAK